MTADPVPEDDEESCDEEVSEEEEAAVLSVEDHRLLDAVERNDAHAAATVQQAIRDGANVNAVRNDKTPLITACEHGFDEIVGILLDAGADAWWTDDDRGLSAITGACDCGHLSTVQLLLNHDKSLLEYDDNFGWTPLFCAVTMDFPHIVRFLLDIGADTHHVDCTRATAHMHACRLGHLDCLRLLLAAGVDVEARGEMQQTALHYATYHGKIEVVRELILQHNANIFAVDELGRTPYDRAFRSEDIDDLIEIEQRDAGFNLLFETYANKFVQDQIRLALHELLKVAEYSFAEDKEFHPPLNPLQKILPLGKLTLTHLRTLMHTLDPELIRNRYDTGKLPIHVACRTNAPVEVLSLILELDSSTLHIADNAGALPIHLLCGTTATTEYASVRYLVEQGGVGTLAARSRLGLLPLHVLCRSTNAPLRAVQCLIQSYPGSVAVRTNAGQYPFMMAAATKSSSASLSVIYELVRANPGLVVPR